MKLSQIKLNNDNPRLITDRDLEKLKTSIRGFERMLSLRPMIVDENWVVLGGNMRLLALRELGYTEIPESWVVRAEDLTEDQKAEFIIKDNVSNGQWDWDMLANAWDQDKLADWGVDIPVFETHLDDDAGPQPEKEPKVIECPECGFLIE